jgi:hypothetical protein
MTLALKTRLKFFILCSGFYLRTTRKGFPQYGYLKNYYLASFLLLIKDNQIRTFSITHIVEN